METFFAQKYLLKHQQNGLDVGTAKLLNELIGTKILVEQGNNSRFIQVKAQKFHFN